MSKMLLEKRASRGQRMTTLIGEAKDKDASFWDHETWADGGSSEDDSFDEEEVEAPPDEFESDFNDTEESDEASDTEEAVKLAGKQDTSKSGVAKGKYREPAAPTKPKAIARKKVDVRDATKSIPRASSSVSVDSSRVIRASTKLKSEDAQVARKEAEDARLKANAAARKRLGSSVSFDSSLASKPRLTQKELLLEALETELKSAKWLKVQQLEAAERGGVNKVVKAHEAGESQGRRIYLSRRGTYDTITFSSDQYLPTFFKMNN